MVYIIIAHMCVNFKFYNFAIDPKFLTFVLCSLKFAALLQKYSAACTWFLETALAHMASST